MAAVSPSGNGQPLRVLVVDDDEDSRNLLIFHLKKLGCAPECAEATEEIARKIAEGGFGLVLLDCRMPGLDGYGLTRKIRKFEAGTRRTRIIGVTAFSTKENEAKCLESGMDGYLPKPISRKKVTGLLGTKNGKSGTAQ